MTIVNANALTTQQALFKKMYKQALSGDETAVIDGKKQLNGYLLSHYLDYALLKSKMAQLPLSEINAFKAQNINSPLNKELDKMLTYEMGKQKQWNDYLKRYKNNRASQTMHCWYLQARIDTKKHKGLTQAITDFWMNGLSLPDACNSVFQWWESKGHINDALIEKRIKLAFKINNAATAGYLADKMQSKPQWINRAMSLMRSPIETLKQSKSWENSPINTELVYIKAKKMGQKQPEEIYKIWPALVKRFSFSKDQIATVDRTIALFAATDYLPFTIDAMDALPEKQHDSQIFAWRTRFHLYNQDWANVLKTIESMPEFQRKKDSWSYWKGRALAKTGNKTEAQSLFSSLSLKTNYYGFLAADHMRLPYKICNEDITATPIAKLPIQIEIAFELFALDMIKEARKEWIIGYQKLKKGEQRALADIAYDKGWYNKVSAIMGALGLWRNYELRYPLAYKEEITKLANKHNLLPQWIMSIITQESAWQTDAISRADARGLMQIIDPTAKRLSKKMGVKYWGKPQLHDADFNLSMGIFYQRLLFDQFDNHPLLALASYNAGESKAKDWLKGFPSAPDIWAETIPYKETRGYITKILTNITIYDWLINKSPRRIAYWMPTFPVDGTIMKNWPNDTISQQTANVGCHL